MQTMNKITAIQLHSDKWKMSGCLIRKYLNGVLLNTIYLKVESYLSNMFKTCLWKEGQRPQKEIYMNERQHKLKTRLGLTDTSKQK